MQLDHIRVFELSHDGSFLQKLDFICFIRSRLQHLHSHFHSTPRGLPHPLVYCPKLARTKMLHNTASVVRDTGRIMHKDILRIHAPDLRSQNLTEFELGQLCIELRGIGRWHPVDLILRKETVLKIQAI